VRKGWEASIELSGDLTDEEMEGSPSIAGQTVFYTRSFPVVDPKTREVTDDETKVTVKGDGVTEPSANYTLTGSLGKIEFTAAPGADKIITIIYSYQTIVGRAQGVSIDHANNVEALYELAGYPGSGGRGPAAIKEGNIEMTGSVEKAYVDRDSIGKSIGSLKWGVDMAGYKGLPEFTMYVYPEGKTSGLRRATLSGVKFDTHTFDISQDTWLMEDTEFFFKTIALGTVP